MSKRDYITIIAELKQLTSVANWDDDNGRPPLPSQWDDVQMIFMDQSICDLVPENYMENGHIDVCGDGYIHLLWVNTNRDRGLLEVGAKHWWWSTIRCSEQDGDPIEIVGDDSKTRCINAITHIKKFFE